MSVCVRGRQRSRLSRDHVILCTWVGYYIGGDNAYVLFRRCAAIAWGVGRALPPGHGVVVGRADDAPRVVCSSRCTDKIRGVQKVESTASTAGRIPCQAVHNCIGYHITGI